MNFAAISQFLNRLTFRQAIWLFFLAFVLHVLEEAPPFTAWANLAFREKLLSNKSAITSFVIAGVTHIFVVAKTVFFVSLL